MSRIILLLLFSFLFLSQSSAQDLSIIENLYSQKDERAALNQIQAWKSKYKANPNFDLLPYLRWEVRIYYKLKNTEKAVELLEHLIDNYNELDYEGFPDKQTHFRAFYEYVFENRKRDFVFVNKFKEDADTSPAIITVYTNDDINLLGARNLMDLIRLTPGFTEISDNNERNFGTRGIFGTTVQHVLVLINGHQINDLLTSSADPSWISLDYIEQIEFMRGPGSALYGGNAFSGIINIITKTGKTFNKSELTVQSGSAQFNSTDLTDHSYKLNLQHGISLGKDKLYFSGTLNYSGGSKYTYDSGENSLSEILPDIQTTGDTLDLNTPGSEYINRYLPGYNIMLNYSNQIVNVTANAQRNQFVINRPNSGNLWRSNLENYEFKERKRVDSREFIDFDFTLFNKQLINSSLDLKFSFSHFRKDFFSQQYATIDTTSDEIAKTRLLGDEWRVTSSLEYSIKDWLFKDKNSLTIFGLQAIYNDWYYSYLTASTYTFDYDGSTNFFEKSADKKENPSALFFQRVQHLINNRLIATMGIRFNHHPIYSNLYRLNNFKWGQAYSPRMSLVYLFSHKKTLLPSKLKLLYSSAFLTPAFLYRRGGIVGFNGTDNLQSQTIENLELGVFGTVIPSVKYSINYYINNVSQFITREDDVYINESGVRKLSGLEIEIKYKNENNTSDLKLQGFLNFSTIRLHTHPESQKSLLFFTNKDFKSEELYYYPTSSLNVGATIRYEYEKITPKSLYGSLTINYNGKTKVKQTLYFDETTESWTDDQENFSTIASPPILNLNIGHSWKQLRTELSIHNFINETHRLPAPVYKSGSMLGEKRTILLKLTYAFKQNKT